MLASGLVLVLVLASFHRACDTISLLPINSTLANQNQPITANSLVNTTQHYSSTQTNAFKNLKSQSQCGTATALHRTVKHCSWR